MRIMVESIHVISEIPSWSTQFIDRIGDFFFAIQSNMGNILWALLTICIILVLARVLMSFISRITQRAMESERYHQTEQQGKRTNTMMTLMRSSARYIIYFVAILLILGQLGFNNVIGNLLVTAGIGSVAIGFGAQSLIKDVVTGFFMMFENQISVGDFVKIDESEGVVEATAMRVTYLRSLKGEQIIIPNGTITKVINYSRGNSTASIIIATPYESDTAQIITLMQQTLDKYAKEHEELLDGLPIVTGVKELNASSVDIGVICKTKVMKQWEVERGMRLALKEAFDENGVVFPYQHITAEVVSPAEK